MGILDGQEKLKKKTDINKNITLLNIWSFQPQKQNPTFLSRIAYYLTFPIHACIWALLYQKQYDVVVTSAPPIFTAITGLFAKIILRKKWVIDIRDLWIDASISMGFLKEGSIYERMSRKFMVLCLHNVDLVCTTTEGISKKLKESYNIKKTILIPNGVDPDIFNPKSGKKKNQIIYTGNVGHAQDLKICILAVKKISILKNIKLLIVGDGDIKRELEEFVKAEKLDKIIIFKGMVPRKKIPKMISESLIGLAPLKKLESLDYAAPTKVFEYMACGIPFLGCGMGEIERLVVESNAGLLADNNMTSIANTIVNIIENPKKSKEMGINGINYVFNNYNRKTIAANLYKQINELREIEN